MDINRIQNVLKTGVIDRARSDIGGSHTTVTYPPLDALSDVHQSDTSIDGLISPVASLHAYIHVSFCEYSCRFCHYAKSKADVNSEGDEVDAYLNALFREFSRRREVLSNSQIKSIYVGGGTPTVLSERNLDLLLEQIINHLGRPHKFCVETSPITLTEVNGSAKLKLLKQSGVSRISLGVQSFDDALLRRHRGHRQADILACLEYLLSDGAQLNIDLIQDLPGQSEQSLEQDLELVERYKPDQVTWYIMRPAPSAPWYKLIKKGRLLGIADSESSALRRLHIIARMQEMGYSLQGGGRFTRQQAERDSFKKVRNGLDTTLLGFGVSAYSHGWGHFFRNVHHRNVRRGIQDYIAKMNKGASPIARVFAITENEMRVANRVVAIRDEMTDLLLRGSHSDDQTARSITYFLLEAGLLETTERNAVRLSSIGRVFEEEISTLFYSRAVRNTLMERDLFWVGQATQPSLYQRLNGFVDAA